jgi:hypothetical protein
MNTTAPIALMQSTDLMRRRMRAAGPDAARRATAPASAPPATSERRPAALLRLLRVRPRPGVAAQAGSDQCSMVAAPRKPARA